MTRGRWWCTQDPVAIDNHLHRPKAIITSQTLSITLSSRFFLSEHRGAAQPRQQGKIRITVHPITTPTRWDCNECPKYSTQRHQVALYNIREQKCFIPLTRSELMTYA